MATNSYKLAFGGFRTGILDKLLLIATKPSHLRTVMQALTIMKNQNPEFVVPQASITTFCKAAVRLNAPEIAISYINMPWLQLHPTQKTLEVLLNYYAEKAEESFISRIAAGEPEIIPVSSTRDETEVAEETKAKRNKKLLSLWLSEFSQVYRDLLSKRFLEWKPGFHTYNPAARLYASVGDIDTAIKILEETKVDLCKYTIRPLMLSLVFHDRANEALNLSKTTFKCKRIEAGSIAAYLALKDKQGLKKYIQGLTELSIIHCQTHFGKEERKKLLIETLTEIAQEKPLQEEITKYLEM